MQENERNYEKIYDLKKWRGKNFSHLDKIRFFKKLKYFKYLYFIKNGSGK
jgi:hypothetical protein